MLNNNRSNSEIKHGRLAQKKAMTVTREISDESLNSVIKLLKLQYDQYQNAGLTQVSTWL